MTKKLFRMLQELEALKAQTPQFAEELDEAQNGISSTINALFRAAWKQVTDYKEELVTISEGVQVGKGFPVEYINVRAEFWEQQPDDVNAFIRQRTKASVAV